MTPFSIEEGARFLARVTPYYPAGTVFLGVVDPGVGTSRKAVIVKSKKEVIGLDDPLGSLITDIQGDDFDKLGYSLGEKVSVKIEQKLYSLPYGKTFMDVPVGETLL